MKTLEDVRAHVAYTEAGLSIPTGNKQELCVYHWLAAKHAKFGAVLDDAEARASTQRAS